MAKTNSYNSGMRILKTLEYLHNLPEPELGNTTVPVKPTDLAKYLTKECGETTRETAKDILNAICDSDTGYMLSFTKSKGGQDQYFFRRAFTLEQISLLSTIIASSMFLTEIEIDALLEQLKTLTSVENAADLSLSNHFLRPRMVNDNSLTNLRIIHEAINNKKALRFYIGKIDSELRIYYEKPIRGKANKLKRITIDSGKSTETIIDRPFSDYGDPIICYPYTLAWDNSRCYLICGIKKNDKVILWNYRVDRMFELKIWAKDSFREPISSPFYDFEKKIINSEKYMQSLFKMFSSERPLAEVTLKFRKSLTRVIAEKFGFDVRVTEIDNEYAQTTVNIQVSRQFFGWLAGFHIGDLSLISPTEIVEEYLDHIRNIYQMYSGL